MRSREVSLHLSLLSLPFWKVRGQKVCGSWAKGEGWGQCVVGVCGVGWRCLSCELPPCQVFCLPVQSSPCHANVRQEETGRLWIESAGPLPCVFCLFSVFSTVENRHVACQIPPREVPGSSA